MDERFDAEAVLRDVLEVLRRHNIPVATAALNVSLLDAAFDNQFPELKVKSHHFRRSVVIDNVPLSLRAQRRYPFDEIVAVLEREIRPPVEAFAESLRREYPDLKILIESVNRTKPPDQRYPLDLHFYQLGVVCWLTDDTHADYNQLYLSVSLHQREATAYPRLQATVGWAVDEESGGEWGLDVVYDAISWFRDYAPHHLEQLKSKLPGYFDRFRTEIVQALAGEPPSTRR